MLPVLMARLSTRKISAVDPQFSQRGHEFGPGVGSAPPPLVDTDESCGVVAAEPAQAWSTRAMPASGPQRAFLTLGGVLLGNGDVVLGMSRRNCEAGHELGDLGNSAAE